MENLLEVDDLGVPLFSETPIYLDAHLQVVFKLPASFSVCEEHNYHKALTLHHPGRHKSRPGLQISKGEVISYVKD